ncbi:MAG: phosphotransferase, partial [Bacteroidota bacterium]
MSNIVFDQIKITEKQAEKWVSTFFNIEGKANRLTGEVDFNFRIKTREGNSYTFKVSRPDTEESELAFQAAMLDHLDKKSVDFKVPRSISAHNGSALLQVIDDFGHPRWIRLQEWIEGRVVDKVNPQLPHLWESWGALAGKMSSALQDFDHAGAHRHFRWDPSNVLDCKSLIQFFRDEEEIAIANYFFDLFEKGALPILPNLRKSVNHNDCHELNVIASHDLLNPKILGAIDFGDAVYTHTINELAIAAAYAAMEKADPLATIAHVIKGYHGAFPLENEELKVLFPLIAARLLISVSHSAYNRKKEPENEYLQFSDQKAWNLLKLLRQYHPSYVYYYFRMAAGWEPCPNYDLFQDWISNNAADFHQVVPLEDRKLHHLDLRVGGKVLGNYAQFSTTDYMHKTIFRYLEDQQADIGIGGYLETRPFYTTDAYEVIGNEGPQWRSVHIGLDFWDKAGVAVYAPLNGTIHSFQNNDADCDYGPTIILEHQVSEALKFYTLYGHLSLDSLDGLYVGKPIEVGERIASIGPAPENGNWPPHLHFKVILDMIGKVGDFPGVAYPHE